MQDGVGRNRDYGPTYGSIACCERQVQYTQLRRTMMTPVAGKRQSLLTVGDDDEVSINQSINLYLRCLLYMTRQVYDKNPQRCADDNGAEFNCKQW